MKVRMGFVSNSSSMSCIVDRDVSDLGILCYKLTKEQIGYMLENLEKNDFLSQQEKEKRRNFLSSGKDLWLTQFLYEGGEYLDLLEDENWIEYEEGEMSENPRCEEFFHECKSGPDVSVWILAEDDKQRSILTEKELIKKISSLKKKKFDVTFSDFGIAIKFL